jgi:ribosomal-protein-alanine N-acetyltransferase
MARALMNYMKRPFFLSSERIGFSTWQAHDLPLATALWGDPQVTRFHGGAWSPQQIHERLSFEIETYQECGAQYWPMFLKETDEHIGCCGLHVRDPQNRIWELGCHLRRAFWSNGLGREAAKTIIDYGFRTLRIHAIFAGHHPANEASRRFLQYLGFEYTHDEFYPDTRLMEPCYLLQKAAS